MVKLFVTVERLVPSEQSPPKFEFVEALVEVGAPTLKEVVVDGHL